MANFKSKKDVRHIIPRLMTVNLIVNTWTEQNLMVDRHLQLVNVQGNWKMLHT